MVHEHACSSQDPCLSFQEYLLESVSTSTIILTRKFTIDDDEAIAVAYRDASYKSLEVVRLLAALDEKEVIEMWADDIDLVSEKLGAVKVGTPGKRAYTSPEHEEQKKKIRLKQFMKQIHVDQRARNRHPR